MKPIGVAFFGTVLAICVALTPVSLQASSTASETPPLAKTIFSANMRMVLAVGVEGTGHDFVLQVHDHMFDTNDQLLPISGKYAISAGPYHIFNSMGTDVHHYSVALDNARRQMRNLAKRATEIPYPGTIALLHGRYSYPDGWGPKKVMKYLDLRMLAEVAEEEGVDFRILYLRRSVNDMIIANTIHRNFQNSLGNKDTTTPEQRYMEYMQILLTDTAVMHSFLAELDPAFVVCHDFDRVGDVEQASMIADFLAPNAYVAGPLQASFVAMANAHDTSTDTLLYEGADVFASRLQRKFDAFELFLCTGK